MTAININIDVSKLHKERFIERSYKNKEGVDVSVKEMKLTLLELKVPRVITSGDGWELHKTHVVVETPTKDEKARGVRTDAVGDGTMFKSTNNPNMEDESVIPF